MCTKHVSCKLNVDLGPLSWRLVEIEVSLVSNKAHKHFRNMRIAVYKSAEPGMLTQVTTGQPSRSMRIMIQLCLEGHQPINNMLPVSKSQ